MTERHEMLRTSIDLGGYSRPMQLVHATAEVPAGCSDLRGLTAEQRTAALARSPHASGPTRFDLAVPR